MSDAFENQKSFKDLTTLNIGGPIKELIVVKSFEELSSAVQKAITQNNNYLVIGGGSNLLVSDDGFDGVVIKNEITGIEKNDLNLIVKSGVVLQDLINFANAYGLGGLENLAGIPGTVGGALFGNAGAYGQTISDHLVSVKVLAPPSNQTLTFTKENCEFSYRDSAFKRNKCLILEATFSLTTSDPVTLKEISDETIKKREVKYPPGIKCPGSFFKNIIASDLSDEILAKIPKEKIVYGKVPAGTLLEMVGAKGDFLRQIKIADYHANLFINEGGGTAKDFYLLAKKYFDKVKEKFEIELENEVQLVNLPTL